MAAALDIFCPHLPKSLHFFFRLSISQGIANHKENEPRLFYNYCIGITGRNTIYWQSARIANKKFIAPFNILFIDLILACYSLKHHREDP